MADYFACPHCGAEVVVGAPACPECGSDETTGWSEEAEYTHLLWDDEPLPAKTAVQQNQVLVRAFGLLIVIMLLRGLGVSLFWLGLLVVVTVGGYVAWQRYQQSDYRADSQLYQALLTRARGDKGLVTRWIEYERQRNPGGDQHSWMMDALTRWERDNR